MRNFCFLPNNAEFVSFFRMRGLKVTKRRGQPIWTIRDGDGDSTSIYWQRGWGWAWTDSWGLLLWRSLG